MKDNLPYPGLTCPQKFAHHLSISLFLYGLNRPRLYKANSRFQKLDIRQRAAAAISNQLGPFDYSKIPSQYSPDQLWTNRYRTLKKFLRLFGSKQRTRVPRSHPA